MFRSIAAFLGQGAAVVTLAAAVSACAPSGVGDPCTPENIPSDGFDRREAYVETGSVQCRTRVCLVYQYDGDPTRCDREECTPDEIQEIENSVFCSSKCKEPTDCPEGFICTEEPIVDSNIVPGTRGFYCVRKRPYCADNPDAPGC